jgi:hypothetical protein
MIYDDVPIIDYFRYVKEDMIAGAMDAKTAPGGTYYFYLYKWAWCELFSLVPNILPSWHWNPSFFDMERHWMNNIFRSKFSSLHNNSPRRQMMNLAASLNVVAITLLGLCNVSFMGTLTILNNYGACSASGHWSSSARSSAKYCRESRNWFYLRPVQFTALIATSFRVFITSPGWKCIFHSFCSSELSQTMPPSASLKPTRYTWQHDVQRLCSAIYEVQKEFAY